MLRIFKVHRDPRAIVDLAARVAARRPFVTARTSRHALALLALMIGACDSGGMPQTPGDDILGGQSTTRAKSSRDASAARPRDAGSPENSDDGSEAADDDDTSAPDDTSATHDVMATPQARADAGPDHDAGVPADAAAATVDPEACAMLTYQSFGKAFLDKYCIECHNSTTGRSNLGGVALDTLPVTMMNNRKLLKRAVIPRTDGIVPAMPKGGDDRLSDAERTTFGDWVDCGLM